MSSLPLGFLTPWQPKQFFLRMGATSLMKLTGPFGAAAYAEGVATHRYSAARTSASVAQRTQKQ